METKKIDIRTLTHAFGQDDRNAFNLFYEAYYNDVFRFAYYFLKNKEACCEVVSDVFLSVWKSRKKLKDIANIEAYLYVVARHEATRYIEKRHCEQFVSIEKIPIRIETEEFSSPEEQLIDQEISRMLTDVINELPERCRTVFLMARQNGMKYKEIAEAMSISEQTVRVQMKIAITKIVSKIRPYFPHLTLTALFFCLSH